MNNICRAALLALYALALVSLFIAIPWQPTVQRITLILLAIHAVELVLMFKHVKAWSGPLPVSILLTLLFGLLHWLPVARANKAS